MSSDTDTLADLRQNIDRIDESLHDLLMERVNLVSQIASAKTPGTIALRPGREASILRRLASRHQGPLPLPALIRIWRELMGAVVGLQQPFSMAVFQPSRGTGYLELARNHFGVVSQQQLHPTVGLVVRAVADRKATVGILPMPREGDDEQWWLSLSPSGSSELPRIIIRLPVLDEGGVGENLQALVIAQHDHEPTGDDRTLVVVETAPDVSRDRLRNLLAAASLDLHGFMALHRRDYGWHHLLEINGYVAKDDPRLAALTATRDPVSHAKVIGGYPVPMVL